MNLPVTENRQLYIINFITNMICYDMIFLLNTQHGYLFKCQGMFYYTYTLKLMTWKRSEMILPQYTILVN